MALCDCNGRRIPTRFKVSIAGLTNGNCSSCASLNGDYYLERSGTNCLLFTLDISGGACGLTRVEINGGDPQNGTFQIQVFFKFAGTEWVYQSTVVDLLAGPLVCERHHAITNCTTPETLTIEAVGPSLTQFAAATCLTGPQEILTPSFSGLPAAPDQVSAFIVPSAWPAWQWASAPPVSLCQTSVDPNFPLGSASAYQGGDSPAARCVECQVTNVITEIPPPGQGPPDTQANQLCASQPLPPPPYAMTLAGPQPVGSGGDCSFGGGGGESSGGGGCDCGTGGRTDNALHGRPPPALHGARRHRAK